MQVTNHSVCTHIQCASNKVIILTRQPACHHLPHISSFLPFLAQHSLENTEIKQVVT